MNLNTLLKQLSYGEFSNLAFTDNGSGNIDADAIPKVLIGINEALIKLYGRFDLNMKEVVVQLHKHITFYYLLPRYAESRRDTSDVPFHYIYDLGKEPFEDEVLKVMQVWGNCGTRLPLNDTGKCNSIFTPQPKLIQVPNPKDGQFLNVLYRSKPLELTMEEADKEFLLPEILIPALKSYTAYVVHSNMGIESAVNQGMLFKNKYEEHCLEVAAEDLVNSSQVPTDTKFESRGFV